jgi:hypothetical protein
LGQRARVSDLGQGHVFLTWAKGHVLLAHWAEGHVLLAHWAKGHVLLAHWAKGHVLLAHWAKGHVLLAHWAKEHVLRCAMCDARCAMCDVRWAAGNEANVLRPARKNHKPADPNAMTLHDRLS